MRQVTGYTKHTLVVCLLAFGACGGSGLGAPPRLAVPDEAIVASFGRLEDSSGVEVLTAAWVAAISPSGRFLAIGDRQPPFVRILDRANGTKLSLGNEGGGPGELKTRPSAIHFLSDSMLLVYSSGRLERFSITGEWLSGDGLRQALLASTVAIGCRGRIFAYGVTPGAFVAPGDSIPWLHEVSLGDPISVTPRILTTTPASAVTGGALYGLDGTDEGILLWHRPMEPGVGYWLPCDGSAPIIWMNTDQSNPEVRYQRQGMLLTLPDTGFAGAAIAPHSEKLWARQFDDMGVDVTALRAESKGECREIQLIGRWKLHDAHEQGLVMSIVAPFPLVLIVDWTWIRERMARIRCDSP